MLASGGVDEPPMARQEVVVGTMTYPILGQHTGSAGGCGTMGTLPIVAHVSRSEVDRDMSLVIYDKVCNNDVSLVGRRDECVEAPGFLAKLLCEDPSLLVGSGGNYLMDSMSGMSNGVPTCQQGCGLQCAVVEGLNCISCRV
jgi:hypothetical protein